MRAAVHRRYGPPEVLRIEDVEPPVPNDDQILVKVHATTVTRGDCHRRSASPFLARVLGPVVGNGGFFRPKYTVGGGEFGGEVAATGAAVTEFAVGDRVFGTSLFGANAEYVCVRASRMVAHMPAGMTFVEAAAVTDGMLNASSCLRNAGPLHGKRILVYGASGSIGTAAVQLARPFGAHVTAVCNTKNVELVRSLGPDVVIDYEREDFTKNGETYDVIMDAVGKHSFRRCRGSLEPNGIFLPTDGLVNAFWLLWTRQFGEKKVKAELPPRYSKEDVLLLKELIESGEYRPVIDRSYPLEEIVDAARYVETGQKVGNVVITVGAP
jgi:NADPH:quinone reductase-like Zn-dependent oxidoreductase